MGFSSTEIDHLFPTPFITARFGKDVAADLNSRLKTLILNRQNETKDAARIEAESWRSDEGLFNWGGDAVAPLLSSLKELISSLTSRAGNKSNPTAPIAWQSKAWAEIHTNQSLALPQMNPGSFWTAIYYVAVEKGENASKASLDFPDPRGPMPRLYCPWLRFGIKGYVSAGMSEGAAPEAGSCFVFPSFLTYAFKPQSADDKTILLTFTFSAPV